MTTFVASAPLSSMSEKVHLNGGKPEAPQDAADWPQNWPNDAGVSQKTINHMIQIILR